MAVDCKDPEVYKCCNKDIGSLVKGETFIISILFAVIAMGLALMRVSKYDLEKKGLFHKLPDNDAIVPSSLVNIYRLFYNWSNTWSGWMVRFFSITKDKKAGNKFLSVFIGLAAIVFTVLLIPILMSYFFKLGYISAKGGGGVWKYWPLYFFGPIWLIIVLVFIAYLLSLIAYLLSTPEFFFATLIIVSSMMLYFYVPQYPYMPIGLSGGGLIATLLLLG